MTHVQNAPQGTASDSTSVRVAIWIAIGALIAAAIVCVVWVLVGTQHGLVGRAFLTVLLLAAFAGVSLLDARLAPRRPGWFALTSMIAWVVTLLLGAFLIWMPERGFGYGTNRFLAFLLIVLILQLAVLHVRLYVKAYLRHVTSFATIVTVTTVALVAILSFMLVFPLAFSEFFSFSETYWRWVVAFAILAAVGTALIPLTNALFAPKDRQTAHPANIVAAASGYAAPVPSWPTYADGMTPLPVLFDGSPDWNAYYTGYPTVPALEAPAPVWNDQAAPQQAWAELGAQHGWDQPTPAPAQPGYDGYPPPPPLPPIAPRA